MLFQRSEHNPLITREALPIRASAVFNPGATEHNGQVVLLLRVEDERGFSNIHVARSDDGVTNWKIERTPLLEHGLPGLRYEEWGCEDPRVTYVGEDDTYYIAYVAFSPMGPAVGLARTRDFVHVERIGLIFGPNNKDSGMFPHKIGGEWWILHRPASVDIENIWSACSPDLIHWGMPHCVLLERGGPWWDGQKVGAGPPPIPTEHGWLLLYHGVKLAAGGSIYRVGAALLDRDQPHKVVARAPGWVFSPEAPYELTGLTPHVVFPCGTIIRGDELWMYYGAADTCICLAIAKLKEVVDYVLKNGGPK